MRFGLDIGIASVGWAVINDDYSVEASGVNLFPSADARNNQERRAFRQARRQKRRKNNRIRDFKKLWQERVGVIPNLSNRQVLNLRLAGISEELKKDELYSVLLNMLKHRGISYLDDALNEIASGKDNYEKGLMLNQRELNTKLPCQIQSERLKNYGKYRGESVYMIEKEEVIFSNVYTTSAYRKELTALFSCQKTFHEEINDEFIEKYLEIFDRKRKYYEGPGSELSRTDYGRFTTQVNPETKEFITEDNIFEKLIGKCSVYPDQLRAAGASYTSQEFNLLNDLNNLLVNGRKLTKEEKIFIVREVKTANTINMRRIIKKAIKEDIDAFEGARVDKKDKEIFHEFKTYNKLRKELKKIEVDITSFSVEELDLIGNVLTLNTETESIRNALKKNGLFYEDSVLSCLIETRKKNSRLFNKWQSVSLSVMQELIPEMYEQPKNQMQLLTEMGVFKTNVKELKRYSKIPTAIVVENIYNPVVRRSVRISVDIVNALIKKYGTPDEIIIEMPRDRNSEEKKKRIREEQKRSGEIKDIISKIEKEYGICIRDEQFRNHKKLALKLKLWNEQNGICLYSGVKIQIEDLVRNPYLFEIDHIIPKSISFDDSRNNKVLVYHTENQAKGNVTPYMYLSKLNRQWGYEEFAANVFSLFKKKKLSRAKVNNLLNMQDVTKVDVLKGFIARNLNDTRFASRVVLNVLQDYFASKGGNTKVKVVRGRFTHQMRMNFRLPKDRDLSFSHHAVDAMLICYSQMGYEAYRDLQSAFIDFDTGEVLDEALWKEKMTDSEYDKLMYQNKWNQIRINLFEEEKNVSYWHKVDSKCNRSLCNQTIRGTRIIDGKIMKVNKMNIYSDSGLKAFKSKIEKNKENDFLMYRYDPKSFENLMIIYNRYNDAENPFVEYEKETGDFVRKYSKKNNGPRIETLKYIDGEVGSCIDISHKYGHERGSKKVILESLNPYRSDVYYNKHTKEYRIVGVKYSDIKCKENKFVIDENAYTKILEKEEMIAEGESRKDLKKHGIEFCFSLYKNSIIRYEKDGILHEERFLSRTQPSKKNFVETKPITSEKFCNKNRNQFSLGKAQNLEKIVTDILGGKHRVLHEQFLSRVDK